MVRSWYERTFLAVIGMVIAYMRIDRADYDTWVWNTGNWITLLMYLPCLLMVLRRPNVWGERDADLARRVRSIIAGRCTS